MNIIFHIDVNNAFLSWTAVELLKNGYHEDIRLIPSVIAGDEDKRHGIVLAKSEISKKYGIKTAEPLYTARRKCHTLKVFPPNYQLYQQISRNLYEYYLAYTPEVEQFSVDECFLDLSNTNYLYDDILKLAYKMKDEIKERFGFTVNIGIGNNKLCAKMAGDFSKPDKVHTLFLSEIQTKMWPLPIEDLLFIGKKTSEKLRGLGIQTIKDLALADPIRLNKYFKNNTTFMIEYANGIDHSKVISKHGKNKSISFSETLPDDTRDYEYLKNKLMIMCEKIGTQLKKKQLYAKTIAITVKTSDFKDFSHQKKILNQTNQTMDLYQEILEIFDLAVKGFLVRNIGIRVTDLVPYKSNQISLFENIEDYKKNEEIQNVLDDINTKYQSVLIMPASFYRKKEKKE